MNNYKHKKNELLFIKCSNIFYNCHIFKEIKI